MRVSGELAPPVALSAHGSDRQNFTCWCGPPGPPPPIATAGPGVALVGSLAGEVVAVPERLRVLRRQPVEPPGGAPALRIVGVRPLRPQEEGGRPPDDRGRHRPCARPGPPRPVHHPDLPLPPRPDDARAVRRLQPAADETAALRSPPRVLRGRGDDAGGRAASACPQDAGGLRDEGERREARNAWRATTSPRPHQPRVVPGRHGRGRARGRKADGGRAEPCARSWSVALRGEGRRRGATRPKPSERRPKAGARPWSQRGTAMRSPYERG